MGTHPYVCMHMNNILCHYHKLDQRAWHNCAGLEGCLTGYTVTGAAGLALVHSALHSYWGTGYVGGSSLV